MDSNSDGRATADKAIALRRAYRMMELKRWRDVRGIPLTLEPKHFPCDDTAATRLLLAAKLRGQDAHRLSLELGRSLWEREETLADPVTIAAAAGRAGLDAAALHAGGPSDAELDALHEQFTKEALATSVFGAPELLLPARFSGGRTGRSCSSAR